MTNTSEILNVLISSALTLYWMSFGVVGQRLSIPRSLEIVVQDDRKRGSRQVPRLGFMHAWRAGFPIKAFGNDKLKPIAIKSVQYYNPH
jgi:hypothetical protein